MCACVCACVGWVWPGRSRVATSGSTADDALPPTANADADVLTDADVHGVLLPVDSGFEHHGAGVSDDLHAADNDGPHDFPSPNRGHGHGLGPAQGLGLRHGHVHSHVHSSGNSHDLGQLGSGHDVARRSGQRLYDPVSRRHNAPYPLLSHTQPMSSLHGVDELHHPPHQQRHHHAPLPLPLPQRHDAHAARHVLAHGHQLAPPHLPLSLVHHGVEDLSGVGAAASHGLDHALVHGNAIADDDGADGGVSDAEAIDALVGTGSFDSDGLPGPDEELVTDHLPHDHDLHDLTFGSPTATCRV